jgi:hypothetical protein
MAIRFHAAFAVKLAPAEYSAAKPGGKTRSSGNHRCVNRTLIQQPLYQFIARYPVTDRSVVNQKAMAKYG